MGRTDSPTIRSLLRALGAFGLLTLFAPGTSHAGEGRSPELNRIGQGDPRDGYSSPDYETRSRAVPGQTGIRAELAELATTAPLGLPELPNPPSQALIDLGRKLFFDRRLSDNNTLSCGMCHIPEQAFTQNELATPVGIEGRFVRRNAPALYNVGYRKVLFHDARETELSKQIWAPLLAQNEMGNSSKSAVLGKVDADPVYAAAFTDLFEEGLTDRSLGLALAGYQRALLSGDSPFDRWFYGGDSDALNDAAKRGFRLFDEHQCSRCHQFSNSYAHFTDDALHRTGIGFRSQQLRAQPVKSLQIAPGVIVPLTIDVIPPAHGDQGLKEISGEERDLWRYRTPSLRNAAITHPYMHDGSLPTLEAVIEFYDSGGGADPAKDPLLVPLGLTARQKKDLEAFLRSLTAHNVDILAADARSAPIGDPVRH